MSRSRRRIGVLITVCAAALLVIGVIYLFRPTDASLQASGHDVPTRIVRTYLEVAVARLSPPVEYAGAHVAGLIPLYAAFPRPTSYQTVFAATHEGNDDNLVAFCRDGSLVGAGSEGFSFDVSEAEALLRDDLGRQPEAIRYVEAGNGFWVVARLGERERGVFMSYQGEAEECWPNWDVYSGAAVLRHLQHVQRYHGRFRFTCAKPDDPWQ